jgi:hypothetical protein
MKPNMDQKGHLQTGGYYTRKGEILQKETGATEIQVTPV